MHSESGYVGHYMAQKAGMSMVDKKAIADKIEAMTANTPKSLHQKELNEKRNLEISSMQNKLNSFTTQQRSKIQAEWESKINAIRLERKLDRFWAHLDFDMFYVACELLDKPELSSKPCAVGGKNSVLCTANYEARKFGVRSALPTFIAVQLCPELHLFEPNFQKYKHFSNIFRKNLEQYDADLESHGLDEAYVDLTEHLRDRSSVERQQFISQIRRKIFEETGLTVSCGVGANKMLAKLASEEKKPNDQFIIENDAKTIEEYMRIKKIRKIPGIGPVNEYYLKGLGIETAEDILRQTDVLTICFSKLTTQFFVCAALGQGSLQHEHKDRLSVGKSETFRPTMELDFLENKLRELCERVEIEMQELNFLSSNVVISYQNQNYQKKDKTFNLGRFTTSKNDLFEACIGFLRSLRISVRLLGLRCTALVKSEDFHKDQLSTFLQQKQKPKNKVEETSMKDLMKAELADRSKFMCPICNKNVDSKGMLSIFNKHIDRCIQGAVVDNNKCASEKNTHSKQESDIKIEGNQTGKKEERKKVKKEGSLLQFLKK